jgi:hypothetical protein
VVGFSEAYVTYVAGTDPGPVRWASPVVWVGGFVFAPLVALTALILLLFPDGRLPSRRWRPLAWAIAAVCLPATVAGALLGSPPPVPPNPLAVGGAAAPLVETVANVGVPLLFLTVLAAAGSPSPTWSAWTCWACGTSCWRRCRSARCRWAWRWRSCATGCTTSTG